MPIGEKMPSAIASQTAKSAVDRTLYEAASTGNLKLLEDVNGEALLSKAPQKNTALHIAARLGQGDFIKDMLGRSPQLLTVQNSQGDTALHCAAGAGCLEGVRNLVAESLLAYAEEGSVGILGRKNKVGKTALHQALRKKCVRVAVEFLRRDPKLAFLTNDAKESPLHLAVKEELQQVVREMLFGEMADRNSGIFTLFRSSNIMVGEDIFSTCFPFPVF